MSGEHWCAPGDDARIESSGGTFSLEPPTSGVELYYGTMVSVVLIKQNYPSG